MARPRPPLLARLTATLAGSLTAVLIVVLPPSARAEQICHWTDLPIVIDGDGRDEAWKRATPIADFRIPITLRTPTTRTSVKLLWDRTALYFLAEMEDHDLFADVLEHDGMTWNNDVFEIFLKPDASAGGYYELQVNAANTRMDMFIPQRSGGAYEAYKSANPFTWQAVVKRRGTLNQRDDRDEGWVVEGKIPWVDLLPTGGRPDVNETWKVAFCRYDYTLGQEPELSSSAELTQLSFHRFEDYANLRFAGPTESDPGLQAIAAQGTHATAHLHGTPEPPLPYRAARVWPELRPEFPIDVRVQPGTRRLVIIEEAGRYGPTQITRTLDDDSPSATETLIDPQGVAYSLAFHPRFEENGWLFVGSNGKQDDGPNKSRVRRYEIARDPPHEVVGEPLTIIEWESNGHNGAAITFGHDGMMYVTTGDGTSDSDENNVGQDLSTLLAKVLRIDVDHPEPGQTYAVPADNPFVDLPGARPETWAYGLRNPWRITTDPQTGQIWVGNNGQDLWEQVYLLERGANYGWSVFEGSHPFYPNRELGPTPHVPPTAEHHHRESRSLTGGVVYHGDRLPELRGAYLYGDHSTGKVWAIKHDGQQVVWQREIADTPLAITAISLDADGEILIVDHAGKGQGGLYRLEPIDPVESESARPFPTRLSDTGLFTDTRGHQVAQGLVPYSVIAPLWSDDAAKFRWIALPPGGKMQMKDNWSWDFPDETVLVKSFAIEATAGDPTTHRWIETRLMLKRQNEWVGYSYAWNEDQTDALLVDGDGEDTEFRIERAGGVERLAWHFPSRTECMVCHTRAANFVLGLSTLQLNRDHDYGDGIPRNQLATLEALDLLESPDWEGVAKRRLEQKLTDAGQDASQVRSHLAALRVAEGQRPIRSRGLLAKPPSDYGALADPYDRLADLNLRARSYLHANCAYCHTDAGGGNAQIDLAFNAPLDKLRLLDVRPLHHTFGITDARLVAPGKPDSSVLLHRVGIREPGQMPQLGTTRVDERARQLLQDWIASLQPPPTSD